MPHPTRRSCLAWTPAAAIALAAGFIALRRPEELRLTDLQVYVGAVTSLRDGGELYDYLRNGNAPFTYPPFAALVMLPLAWFPAWLLHLAWTAGTALAAATLAILFTRRTAARTRNRQTAAHTGNRQTAAHTGNRPTAAHTGNRRTAAHTGNRRVAGGAPAPLLALALMLSAPVSSTFKYGQVSLLLAVLVTADVLALRHSRYQGVLTGLAAAIKLTPLIFIPMLWLTGRRRAAGVAAATFAACGALAAASLPHESWRYWGAEFHDVSRLGFITSVGNQSLNGALMRLDVPRHELLATLLAGAVAALALRHIANQLKTRRVTDPRAALVATGAAAVVLSPVSWTHHQVWLVLAAFLPLAPALRAAVLAIMLLPVTALPWWPLQESRLLLAVTLALLLPSLTARPRDAASKTAPRNATTETPNPITPPRPAPTGTAPMRRSPSPPSGAPAPRLPAP
jgi:alpha-1,2-mannosyltransferase